tara:strand:- start:81 stop:557 length:477 start_codon:yes stop_codon:yes gene_type:complete
MHEYAYGPVMERASGQVVVETLGGQDLNLDGSVINLAIVGSSRFYDFEIFESALEEWISENTYPDLIIVGGASGVDYMAERWTDNNLIPIAIFSEEWNDPQRGLIDRERGEAPNSLTEKILSAATHILAMPSPTSKWTRIVIERAESMGIPTIVIEVE